MKISSKEIKLLLIEANLFNPLYNPKLLILDTEFTLLPDRIAKQIISNDDTNTFRYQTNRGDCDNYAFELRSAFGRWGYCCGILIVQPDGWKTAHAVFFWINSSRQLRIIEPQTDLPFSVRFCVLGIVMY